MYMLHDPTPLQVAAAKGHVDVALALIQAGAHVDRQHETCLSPLMLASNNNLHKMTRVLIKAHADLDLVSLYNATSEEETRNDTHLATALDLSVKWCHVRIVQILLEARASPTGARGSTLTTCLRQNRAADTRRGGAGAVKQAETARLLLQFRADHESTASGDPPLCHACYGGNHACVKLLLERGASVNAVGHDGRSALMVTTQAWSPGAGNSREDRQEDRAHQIEIAQELLQANADINLIDDHGNSAVDLAVEGKWTNKALAKLLVDAGAKFDADTTVFFDAGSESGGETDGDDDGSNSDGTEEDDGSNSDGTEEDDKHVEGDEQCQRQ